MIGMITIVTITGIAIYISKIYKESKNIEYYNYVNLWCDDDDDDDNYDLIY